MHNLIRGQGWGLDYKWEMSKNDQGHREENFNPGVLMIVSVRK